MTETDSTPDTGTPPHRTSYRHGNLTVALVAAAVAIIEERGVEHLSLRDVAKRVGVSSGAPFRHFASKKDLLTAVAVEAMGRLTAAIQASLQAAGAESPRNQLQAIGRGYLTWAVGNPTHFQVISSRTLIDFAATPSLVEQNDAIRRIMADMIAAGRADASIRADLDPDALMLALRAFGYGLARMTVDGHLPEWHVQEPSAAALERALDLIIDLLAP